MKYKPKSNKGTGQTETQRHGQWTNDYQRVGQRGKKGWRKVDGIKGVKYMVAERNLTVEVNTQCKCICALLLKCTDETYQILLTNVTI